MRFVLGGLERELDADMVRSVAERHTPEASGRHKYYVSINGRRYPVKQLFSLATGIQRTEFITNEAVRHLKRLGFTVEESRWPSAPPPQAENADFMESYRGREVGDSVTFAVSLEPDEDGFIVASCPQLPGCHSQGRSRPEAIRNIGQAIRGYIASMKSHGEEIPRLDWDLVAVDV